MKIVDVEGAGHYWPNRKCCETARLTTTLTTTWADGRQLGRTVADAASGAQDRRISPSPGCAVRCQGVAAAVG